MRNLREYDSTAVNALLATNKMDVSKTVSPNGVVGIPPDAHNRTILIGIGGTGIKTLERVKGTIKERLDDTWPAFISFLGIDSDEHEIDNCNYLKRSECIITTRPGVEQRAQNAAMYPKAWRPFADPETVSRLQNLSGNGSGRKRLAGKLKIHDEAAGSSGVDTDIINKLIEIKGQMILTGNQKYEVYVIGSLIGGTCSGSFLEMPALVRRALNNNPRVHVNAVLYLPDTMSGRFAEIKDELEANGYASLKELNYFEGMRMRNGYSEEWPDNSSVDGRITLSAADDFFTMPYLIGTVSGATESSEERARETIAEYFISILGSVSTTGQQPFLVDSFVNNAMQNIGVKPVSTGNQNVEAPGSSHEFPKRFASIGFAKAAAPHEIVYAYAVSEACVRAGLVPVDAATHAAKKLANEPVLPFLAADQYLTATQGVRESLDIIRPLIQTLDQIKKSANFSYQEKYPNVEANWDNIRGNKVGHPTDITVKNFIQDHTSTQSLRNLDAQLAEALNAIIANVKAYVNLNGPMAFVNLFNGNFVQESGKGNTGVREMLERIRDKIDPATNNALRFETGNDKKREFDDADKQIKELDKGGLVGGVKNAFTGFKADSASVWETAFNDYVNAQIQDKYREHLYGSMKAIEKNVLDPAIVLCEQIRAFGEIMVSLSAAYQAHGEKLTDFDSFTKISDSQTEVNIAAVNANAHNWLVEQAQQIAASVDGAKIRKALIDSFFKKPDAWLEFQENLIDTLPTGEVRLKDPERPVPARTVFDNVMHDNIQMNIDVSIKTLFMAMNNQNISYAAFAQQTIDRLVEQSKPLFNGDLDDMGFHRFIMYPASLSNDAASQPIVTAIQSAATNAFPNASIGFYGSGYADGIMMYQFAAPFEVYRLKDLLQWEQSYRKMINRAGKSACLHSRAPHPKEETLQGGTIKYTERNAFTWYDYPEIIRTDSDPKLRDPKSGEISREGIQRLALDKIIEEAKETGVLYSNQEADGWYIYRVFCDRATDWRFDADWMAGNEELGKAFIRVLARRNRRNMEDISAKVVLENGGLLEIGADLEERAWERAARVLRAHVPMYHEVRETLELVRPWVEEIKTAIAVDAEQWIPAKVIRLMQAHVLYRNENDIWMVTDEDGNRTSICKMGEKAVAKLANKDPQSSAIVEAGMSLFYIYRKFRQAFEDADEIDTLFRYSKKVMEDEFEDEVTDESTEFTNNLLNQELERLEALGVDMDSPDRQKQSVYNKFKTLDIDEKETVDEICKFYCYARRWKKVK